MGLSYRARRRLSLVLLLVWLPLYVAASVTLMSVIPRPTIWVEIFVYVALGLIWALPFRYVFRGVGKADPDAEPSKGDPEDK